MCEFCNSQPRSNLMTESIRFIPFRSITDQGWTEAWALYENSFPQNEQWHEADYVQAFSDPLFEADGIWLGDRFAGILFHWQAEGYRYVEHLAIVPDLRGQRMGSRTLKAFCNKFDKVILEIDPPVDEVSIRRQRFYEQLGFVTNPYEYIHPSFHEPFKHHNLVLLSYPEAISYDQARLFADFVRETVLRYSGHENPTLPRLP